MEYLERIVRSDYRDLPEWKIREIAKVMKQHFDVYEDDPDYTMERLHSARATGEKINRIKASESEAQYRSEPEPPYEPEPPRDLRFHVPAIMGLGPCFIRDRDDHYRCKRCDAVLTRKSRRCRRGTGCRV